MDRTRKLSKVAWVQKPWHPLRAVVSPLLLTTAPHIKNWTTGHGAEFSMLMRCLEKEQVPSHPQGYSKVEVSLDHSDRKPKANLFFLGLRTVAFEVVKMQVS